jgi:hypothetical protein
VAEVERHRTQRDVAELDAHDEAVREERLARGRLRNLESARRVQAARRRREKSERRERERARIRELKEDEAKLSREYSAALREASKLGPRASQKRFEEAWGQVDRVGNRLRSVIASRRQMEARQAREASAPAGHPTAR